MLVHSHNNMSHPHVHSDKPHTAITCDVCGETTYLDHEYCVHCGANNAPHRGVNQTPSVYLSGAELYTATEAQLNAYFGKGWRNE